jgi:Tol biopolymer transport system component
LPAFFPAGEILFSQDIEDGSALFLLDLKENKKKSIYCDGMALFPALSRDGATIALTLKSSDTYQIATTPLQNMELSVLTFSNVSSKWPSFSMDGSKIVFQRTRSDKDEILIMNSNGEKQHPLGWEGRRPDYSPTRDEIIFELDVMGISNIFRGTIGEKEIENLTKVTKKEDACFSPSFSPDGDWVLFHRKNKGLWVMKSDGTKQNKILAENFATMMGRISPDGKYLAVCAGNGPSKGNLYLYTLSSPAFGSQLQQTGQIASRFPLKPRVVPKLYINAIPWADVILNGELKGTTPLTLYNVPVNAVIVLKYELYEKTFKVEQLKENRLSYDFPSQSR